MIKDLKPSGRFDGGQYQPHNPEKYVGKYPIVYRSSWEKKLCFYLDTSEKVIRWASEPFEIPYISRVDKRKHRYYPDFYFKVKSGIAEIEYVAEVKPNQQLNRPKKPKIANFVSMQKYNAQLKNYLVIISKMEAAKLWCESKGFRYCFIDEIGFKKLFK